MSEQTGGDGNVVVTGDDSAVANPGEEADVADVAKRGRGKKPVQPPRWVNQYLHQTGLSPKEVQKRREQLQKDHFV
jgi:hypothetical protein